jgi:anti-sigma B factor antagonist
MATVGRFSTATVAVTIAGSPSGEIVISIAGELDMSNVAIVRWEVETLLAADPTSLIFDLSEVGFMDSSGIALLVQVASRVEAISLRHVPGLVRRVLEATGVTEVLVVEP